MASQLSRGARTAVIAMAVIFAFPMLLMPWSDDRARTAWEKRPLTEFSQVIDAVGSAGFFPTLDDYFDDHVFAALEAARIYRKVQFLWFDESPQPNIAIADDGFVFLTSHGVNRPFGSLERLCTPAERHPGEIHEGLQRLAEELAERDVRLSVAVVPSKLSLYADRLPATVPQELREACDRTVPERTVAARLLERQETARYLMLYPFEALYALRDTPQFYPPQNFHADSRVNHEYALLYFESRGLQPPPGYTSAPTLVAAHADLRSMGFLRNTQVWRYGYQGEAFAPDRDQPDWLSEHSIAPRGYRHFTNDAMQTGRTLMVSDSFGAYLAPHFAPAYVSLTQLNIKHFSEDVAQRDALLHAALQATEAEELIILLHDVGLPNPIFRNFIGY
ncbi:MAG: hypothetical protein Cons2KO_31700 [Congregibacter sp.]